MPKTIATLVDVAIVFYLRVRAIAF